MSTTPSPETKPTTTETKSTTEAKAETKPTVPETYADFKAPEGLTLNKEAIAEALPVFKELGLTQEQAQRLVEIQAKRDSATAKGPQDAYQTMRADWVKDTLANPELATGGKLKPEVSQTISRGIDSMGADKAAKFREIVNTTGIGDHPDFVAAIYEMAKSVTEGRPVQGGGPSTHGQQAPGITARPSVAKALYPNNP